jgi:hypothetical protein
LFGDAVYFQHILKGIPEAEPTEVERILTKTGIRCNWWRRVGRINDEQIKAKLNADNLYRHLEHYHEVPPGADRPFRDDTPFISTTGGTAVEDRAAETIYIHDAFWEAAIFATRTFKLDGWIFYGYVYALGKPAVELQEFAEEVRDFHLYPRFSRWRHQGEITAKIGIPSVRLRCAELYHGPELAEQLRRGKPPAPAEVLHNKDYCPPERYTNILGWM